jgi:hypothetical protein
MIAAGGRVFASDTGLILTDAVSASKVAPKGFFTFA